ncbi:MAG TPA: hypothetical protein VFZ62_01100 [Candidatus Saccharimonadales bacterium]
MNTLLVGYDLNRSGQRYKDLLKLLKSTGVWWHNLDSTLLLKTDETPSELLDKLVRLKLVDSNDEVLIIDVTGRLFDSYGFSQTGTEWLEKHL